MGKKIGIDLGISNTLIYIEGEEIVSQVSAVAVEEDSGKFLAAGNEAVSLCGRIPGAAHLEYPFRSGVDIHSESFVYYMRQMIATAGGGGLLGHTVLLCLPGSVPAEAEEDIYKELRRHGVRDVMLVSKIACAAAGAGISDDDRGVSMIVDLGGGETQAATFSLGRITHSSIIGTGGDALDASIAAYLAISKGLRVNFAEAERIKTAIGGVWKRDSEPDCTAFGVNVGDGLPNSCTVTGREIFGAISEPVKKIAVGIRSFYLSLTPTERCSIAKRGIILTGGGSCLFGMPELLGASLGEEVKVTAEPLATAALGFSKILGGEKAAKS